MQAIVTKMSAGKDSIVKPIAKIDISVQYFRASAVCFKSRVEKEIALVSGGVHAKCTPFVFMLPSLRDLKTKTLETWRRVHSEAFEKQARVSGLKKGGSDDDDED